MIGGTRGFTLTEILVAVAVISIGLVGVAIVVPVASFGLHDGRLRTSATFLAEERLEQVRSAVWDAWRGDCLGISASPAAPPTTATCPSGGTGFFPDESPEDLPPAFQQFSRTVRVTPCSTPGACPIETEDARRVTVTVRYLATSALGANASGSATPVVLNWLVAKKL